MVPCKDCTNRKVGCHSGCNAYLLYKQDLSRVREKKKFVAELKSYIAESCMRRQRRSIDGRYYG